MRQPLMKADPALSQMRGDLSTGTARGSRAHPTVFISQGSGKKAPPANDF
jgi:hypothetical protein